MTRFRFVHAADLHLDTPFEGVGRTPPVVADALRDASLEAWDALVRLTLEREAAFLLVAGDICDGARRGLRAQVGFRRGLEQLAERDVQVFLAHGDHDPLEGWSGIRQWPRGVTLFGASDVQSVAAVRNGSHLATIHGISYSQRETHDNLALRFHRGEEPGLHIGLLHCNAGVNVEHAPYSLCTLDDLRQAGMDYWALGHCHRLEILSGSAPVVAYPGCLQGRSMRPSEFGPKGALVVEADAQGAHAVDHVALDRVRLLTIEIDTASLDGLASLRRTLTLEAERLRRLHDTRGLLLRARLSGRGPLYGPLHRPGGLERLLLEIREDAAGLEPFAWWTGLVDETRPNQSIDGLRARGDLTAELVRLNDGLRQNPAQREAWLFKSLEPLRQVASQPWLPVQARNEDVALLDAAEHLALSVLEDDL